MKTKKLVPDSNPRIVNNNACFRWFLAFFGYQGKTGKERNLALLKDKPMVILIERYRRDLFIDIVV